ncbi:MAG TPA: hypothetical protein VG365_03480 [Solirubrobacteraceae bacterium]|nr:hypothetical protein [Solirubrobacteraceae bacterium]
MKLRRAFIVAPALACGFLMATTLAAVASTSVSVSPRDNCGGFNGHVVWSGGGSPFIRLYGEVWDNNCSGSTSVWLSWDSPAYHNINANSATEPQTVGVNYKTGTSSTPQNIKVAVCSTHGGWHCGNPVSVSAPPTRTTTSPTTTSTPPAVTTPVPQPTAPHELAVKLRISWTWNHAVTQLHTTKIGSLPGRAQIFVQCGGRGCPGKRDISARGARNVRRLLRALRGKHYRAGDRLLIVLKAPGYLPERALVKIRNGKLPQVTLLPA